MRPTLWIAPLCLAALVSASEAFAQLNNKPVTPDMSDRQASALQERYRASDYDQGVDALVAGRFGEAARHLQRAIKAAPEDATLLTVYGQALEGLQDLSGAEAAFVKALAINPDQLLARREHGVVLARLGRRDAAQAELNALKARAAACDDDCVGAADIDHAVDVVRAALGPASTPTAPETESGPNAQPPPRRPGVHDAQ